jgi:hypothetical protein
MNRKARSLIIAAIVAFFGVAFAQPVGTVTAVSVGSITEGGNEWG